MNNRRRYALAVLAALGIATLPGCATLNHQTQTCTVDTKDRIKGENGSEMRVYTDCGTFTVGDNIVSGFSSADLFGSLKVDHTYVIKTGGFRVGIISQFPIILEAKDVTK